MSNSRELINAFAPAVPIWFRRPDRRPGGSKRL